MYTSVTTEVHFGKCGITLNKVLTVQLAANKVRKIVLQFNFYYEGDLMRSKNSALIRLSLSALVVVLSSFGAANANAGKCTVDVVSGTKCLGRVIGKGATVFVKDTHRAVLKPAAVGVKEAALMGGNGTVWISGHVYKGGKKAVITVDHAVTKSGEAFYEDVLNPLYTEVLVNGLVKTVIYKGAVKPTVKVSKGAFSLFIKPVGLGAASAGKTTYSVLIKGGTFVATKFWKGTVATGKWLSTENVSNQPATQELAKSFTGESLDTHYAEVVDETQADADFINNSGLEILAAGS